MWGPFGGEDTEKVSFVGGAGGETAVRRGLGGHHSSIHEGGFELYESGSTLRSRFGKLTICKSLDTMTNGLVTAFHITKEVMVAVVQCVLYGVR